MIGVPFDNNDLTCLGSISEVVADLVARRDPLIVELAAQHPTTEALAAWIRSLPQRDDDGIPGDGPKVEACQPVQRLRIPAPDPNCVERAALYLGVAELIDPWPVRQLATLDFDWGRHTFPIESGAPVVLDPRVTTADLARAVTPAAPKASSAPRAPAPVAIEVTEAIEYTAQLAESGAQAVRNGPSRARLARNAIRSLVETGTPPSDERTVDAMGWFFATAEQVARAYGARALTIVRTTAQAIADLLDDVLARQQRNLSFEINGTSFKVPSWVSGLGSLVGRIGLDVGAVALAPKLAAMGITGSMLQLVEEELNVDGLTLGPLAKPGTSMASALGALGSKRTM
ncbi:MAG TPA: hypothetical protein VF469_28565 [Kofleriaceae bacterium]